ncbi:glycine zipper 2TM domain-containing protein [Janthinobacterium agaricidamnosum]|uniref:Rickettsia 17 kDa surface antigen family protein n=1 Tax=Janthinobacterium agaricidamnosum NBRC 102515 = DSM 9628 TaxID=1349767 RepID=W0V695_9BURK|nr:glycine zipper 2TM domain-containing protein [Janthinobacterium agaricidamnosum]CDG84349.1 rickettsia 17 kDa surface antigen family protein [Janthinobacterium agaricidamnosum NBRC 102515 = DSM 9628]
MKTNNTLAALMMTGAVLLTGCASTQQAPGYSASQPESATYGTIDSIQMTQGNASGSGLGAVAGGVVGALLGNQVGSGGGRTAATVAGAVGGAVVGNEVEKNRAQSSTAYQISVRLDNGEYRTVIQDSVVDLRPGNRVRVIDGRVYRY